ncbi:MAG: DNA-binding protein WhiA [Eggerthellaceae bacterium]|jgi:DNA-binding protein WhiA|nr:DNA-binding protein WhiA [Eggerthellaceae bacterium]MCH4221236.1 DNA-binding protein WhiA [Eggerthellaceae bacterium]
MSFTADVKEELARVIPTCSHCDRATLAALVRTEGSLLFSGAGRYRVEIDTDSPSVARLMVRLLHVIYHLHTELTMRRSVLHKTPNYLINVPMQPRLEAALIDLGILKDHGIDMGIEESLVEKRCCASAYLRGAFLGSGFIANPRGDFHFEMTFESDEFARDIIDLMRRSEIDPRMMKRRNSYIVYLKSGSAISAFLAFVGAHQCALAMENERVIKSVRNDVNRRVNAEVANQAKSAEASVDQIMAIREVVDHYGINQLPAALRDIIKLRVAYPDATLKELGSHADPPLSKSAVYHRVRRIEQMAAQIKR